MKIEQHEVVRSPLGREQLVALAREAGDKEKVDPLTPDGNWIILTPEELERFAALVAEAEGKRLVNACEDARFEDGDGRYVEWYKGFDCCAATLNAERIETK